MSALLVRKDLFFFFSCCMLGFVAAFSTNPAAVDNVMLRLGLSSMGLGRRRRTHHHPPFVCSRESPAAGAEARGATQTQHRQHLLNIIFGMHACMIRPIPPRFLLLFGIHDPSHAGMLPLALREALKPESWCCWFVQTEKCFMRHSDSGRHDGKHKQWNSFLYI